MSHLSIPIQYVPPNITKSQEVSLYYSANTSLICLTGSDSWSLHLSVSIKSGRHGLFTNFSGDSRSCLWLFHWLHTWSGYLSTTMSNHREPLLPVIYSETSHAAFCSSGHCPHDLHHNTPDYGWWYAYGRINPPSTHLGLNRGRPVATMTKPQFISFTPWSIPWVLRILGWCVVVLFWF